MRTRSLGASATTACRSKHRIWSVVDFPRTAAPCTRCSFGADGATLLDRLFADCRSTERICLIDLAYHCVLGR